VPSKNPTQRFEDILSNIAMIEAFTAGMTFESFSADLKTSNAVERCLERISEAAKKLEGQAEALVSGCWWKTIFRPSKRLSKGS
jgi:uncharacterized protein with HEPN domain